MVSLNALASIIHNSINGGRGITSDRISFEQLVDEVVLTRTRLLQEYLAAQKPFVKESLYQWIHRVKVEKTSKDDLQQKGNIPAKDTVYFVDVPDIIRFNESSFKGIRYIGGIDKSHSFKIVTGDSKEFATYDRITGKLPYAWYNGNRISIFNYNKPLEEIAIEAIFQDPRELVGYNSDYKDNDSAFPLDAGLQDILTGKIINAFATFTMKTNPAQPNVQIDRT